MNTPWRIMLTVAGGVGMVAVTIWILEVRPFRPAVIPPAAPVSECRDNLLKDDATCFHREHSLVLEGKSWVCRCDAPKRSR